MLQYLLSGRKKLIQEEKNTKKPEGNRTQQATSIVKQQNTPQNKHRGATARHQHKIKRSRPGHGRNADVFRTKT